MSTSVGPTQGAQRHEATINRWKSHPRLALLLRALILVSPVALSIGFTLLAGRLFPPEDVGLGKWTWVAVVFVLANLLLITLRALTARLLPLVALMKLTLVFPDHAPSRARATMRRSSSRALLREVEEARARGETAGAAGYGDYLVQLLQEVNEHDRLTRGHSERVKAYAEMIGEEIKLDDEEMNKLRWSALLHDVGKISVPFEILNKNGRPTDEEWKVLASHPAAGGEMLEPLRPWLGDWVHSADQHHCRWDGKGYPHTLAGKDITLAGRLVAIADAFDVMTSARSYKKPLTPELARQELTACAGEQFDPQLVRAFLQVGLNRLKTVAGPLAWIANLTGSMQIPVPAAGVITSGAVSAGVASAGIAVATFTGLVTTPEVEPPVLAFEEPSEVVIEDLVIEPIVVSGVEGSPIEVVVTARGGEGNLGFSFGEPEHGEATITIEPSPTDTDFIPDAGDGWDTTITYTPEPGYFGSDVLMVEVCDEVGTCELQAIAITIISSNRPPIAGPDSASVDAGETIEIDVLDNDSDPDRDLIQLRSVGGAAHGEVVITGASVVYTADEDYGGADSFEYTISDPEGATTTGQVSITVVAPPVPTTTTTTAPTTTTTAPTTTTTTTAPANPAPSAVDDLVIVDEDGIIRVSPIANDSDPDGEPLSLTGIGTPGHGVAVIDGNDVRYAPDADYSGSDLVTYRVSDGTNTVVGSIVITVTPRNDAPVIVATGLTVAETAAPGSIVFTISATDVDGDPLTFSIDAGDPGALFSVDASGVGRLVGALDFETTPLHTLDVTISDGTIGQTVTVDVTVSDVNEQPMVVDDLVATTEDTPFVFALGGNDSDPDGDVLTWNVPATTTAGTPLTAIDDDVSYSPPADFNGADTFTYTVADPGGLISTSASVTIMVVADNDPPVATDDAGLTYAVAEDASITTGNVTINDTDVDSPIDPTSTTVITDVTNGTLTNNGNGTFDYAPDPNHNGTDTFTYTITDAGALTSNTATVTLTITPDNDAPMVTNPGAQAAITGEAFSLSIVATDVELDGLSYGATGLPPGLSIGAAGLISGTVGGAASGTYTVDVTVTDDGTPAQSTTVTFDIVVEDYQVSSLAGSLHMTEVMYAAGLTFPTDEFVEITNSGGTPIDLTGFRIADSDHKNDGVQSFYLTIPATDHWGTASTLQPGEQAVIWLSYDGVTLPPVTNPATGLEFVVFNGGGSALDNFGDSLWLLEDPNTIIDYMAYMNGGGDTTPPASLGLWDDTDQAALLVAAFGQSLSLTPHNVDGNTASCWEETGSGDAAGRCAGAPITVDKPAGGLRHSASFNNNDGVIFGAHVMISEFSNVGGDTGGNDFIELYNPTAASVDIEGWLLSIANDTAIVQSILLTGPNTILPAGGHYLLDELGAADQTLVAMPDELAIRIADGGTPVDEVGTAERTGGGSLWPGLWSEGTGVPPLVDDNNYQQSWERKLGYGAGNCSDTDDNASDFERRLNAQVNPQSSTDPVETCGVLVAPAPPTHLVISEFRSDGPNGGQDELVEIFNPTSAPINLSGYELQKAGGGGSEYTFPAIDLAPGQHYLTGGSDYLGAVDGTHGGFSNGDGVALYDGAALVDELVVGNSPPDLPEIDGRLDQSYVRRFDGCQDTDVLIDDFVLEGNPKPRTYSDPATPC